MCIKIHILLLLILVSQMLIVKYDHLFRFSQIYLIVGEILMLKESNKLPPLPETSDEVKNIATLLDVVSNANYFYKMMPLKQM